MDEKRILKNSEYKNFTAVPNVLINNISMSCQARFLYIYMLSKPNNWKFYLNDLSKSLGMSIDTLRKYIKELIEQGWIIRNKQEHDEVSKKFDAVSYEVVFPCREKAVSEKFRDGKNSTLNNKDNKQKNKENKKDNKESVIEKDPQVERFTIWMQKEYPHVCKMKKPLTLDEYNKLRDLGYSSDQITSKLDVLENRDDYIRRYRSPYLCVRNWLKSDFTKVKR